MISHLIKWDHAEDWFVTRYDTVKRHISGEKVFRVSLQDQDYFYISGHCIDSRVLFPATAYLFLGEIFQEEYNELESLLLSSIFELSYGLEKNS